MHSTHRSSLRRTTQGGIVYVLLIILMLLFVIGSCHCLKLQKTNNKLNTIINNHASTIEALESTSNELNVCVNELKDIIQKSTYTYDITAEEREMLARLVYREANVESIECQMAVVSVVINRWQSGQWGNTLQDVVYAKSQFSPAGILYRTTPNETNYQAVDEVIKNGVTLPSYILYFRANYHFQWDGYNAYTIIDDTYFGYFTRDM